MTDPTTPAPVPDFGEPWKLKALEAAA